MLAESDFILLLAVLGGSLSLFGFYKVFVESKRITAEESELRGKVLRLQSMLCDVSADVSSCERALTNIYNQPPNAVVQNVSRARVVVTALYRRLEQVSALLDTHSPEGVAAAKELLERSISTKLDSLNALVGDTIEAEEIEAEAWEEELRAIRRSLPSIPMQRAA